MPVPLRTDQLVVAKSPASSVLPTRLPGTPPMRDDRICIAEGCGKPLTRVGVRHEDPFCSTVCCRAWYGVADTTPAPDRGRGFTR